MYKRQLTAPTALQVVYFVCMAGRMETALENAAAEQEVRAALESVFPFSMLAQFLTLSSADKQLQLSELPYIVLGICGHNLAAGVVRSRALAAALRAPAVDVPALHARCSAELQALQALLRGFGGARFPGPGFFRTLLRSACER